MVKREVYFAGRTTVQTPANGTTKYFPTDPPTAIVNPGRYALIGPGDKDPSSPSHTKTYIGFLSGQTSGTSTTRYIDMDGDPPNIVQNNTNNPADPTTTQVISPSQKSALMIHFV